MSYQSFYSCEQVIRATIVSTTEISKEPRYISLRIKVTTAATFSLKNKNLSRFVIFFYFSNLDPNICVSVTR